MDKIQPYLVIILIILGSGLYLFRTPKKLQKTSAGSKQKKIELVYKPGFQSSLRNVLFVLFVFGFLFLLRWVFHQPPPQNPIIEKEITDVQAKENFYKASKLFDDKEYSSAITLLAPVVDKKTDIFKDSRPYSYAYLILGASYLKAESPNNDPQKAVTLINMYLDQNSHVDFRPFARECLSQIYESRGNTTEAEKILLDGIKDHPDITLFRTLGNYYSDRNYSKAIKYYEDGLKIKPGDYWIYLGISSIQIEKKMCQEAKLSLKNASDFYIQFKTTSRTENKDFEEKLNNNNRQFEAICQ